MMDAGSAFTAGPFGPKGKINMDDQIQLVDIEKIDPPIDVFRDLIDPDKIRELGESIRSQGLIQPIIIRPYNGRYEIVAGHRRFLAHRLIGEVKIKSIIREMSDEEAFGIRAVENDQREDLNPIERAKIYKRLKEKFGLGINQIARKMGRSHSVIDKYLYLLEIPEEFQEGVALKKISMQVALVLNKIEDPEFKSFYFKAAIQNGITIDIANEWLNEWRKTRANEGYNETGGAGEVLGSVEAVPIYQACACCLGPCEIKNMKLVYICPDCDREIKMARLQNPK